MISVVHPVLIEHLRASSDEVEELPTEQHFRVSLF